MWKGNMIDFSVSYFDVTIQPNRVLFYLICVDYSNKIDKISVNLMQNVRNNACLSVFDVMAIF